jgi:hypothetical protein
MWSLVDRNTKLYDSRVLIFWMNLLPHLQAALKMEAVFSSKMLEPTCQPTWFHSQEDHNMNFHLTENLSFI